MSRGPAAVETTPLTGDDTLSDLVATIGLTLFSLAVAAGFARVFSGWEFFDNLAVVAIVGHGTSFVLRRLRTPWALSFPAVLVVVTWLVGVMFYRDTYSWLLPTSETWQVFRVELSLVGDRFPTTVAPVPFLEGWNALAAIGIGAVVALSDTFAFRAYARAEALVPGGVLFVFISALGSERSRVALTGLLIVAGLLATLGLRLHHAPAPAPSISRRPTTTARRLRLALPGAIMATALVAGIATFVGPRVPGADAEALYDTTGGSGGSVTEVLSPLVDIRSRLTNRSTRELFVVEANADSYWRSSALPKFDGNTWGLPERPLSGVDGPLAPVTEGATEIRQRVWIAALGGSLIPAAADPIAADAVSGDRDDLKWNPETATLVWTDGDLLRGDSFEIVSAAPRFSADRLRTATSTDAGDPIYTELPDDFPSVAVQTAREVTAGADSAYDTAIQLQNWFRDEFTYSLEIQEGHGNNAIESFLRNRVGYCEQFAGTYAAMMRGLGSPTRVAVGFTPGENDGTGRYSVLGRNAHAWPEVWFDGLGWVPFEPTPGRGAPNAEQYTGVEQQQDDGALPADGGESDGEADEGDDTGAATTVPPTTATPRPTSPVQSSVPAGLPGNIPDTGGTAGAPAASESEPGVPWRLIGAMLLIGGLLAAPAVARSIRRRPRPDGFEEVTRLWTRALDSLRTVGVEPPADATPREVAVLTAERFPSGGRPMEALARVVTESTYRADGDQVLAAAGSYGSTALENCSVWTRQIDKAVRDSLQPISRVRRYFANWS